MAEKVECYHMSWEEMHDLSTNVAKQIRDSGFKPDLVIALARGGLVPARAICDFLVHSNLVAIKVEHWGITAGITGDASITYSLNMDLKDKKILLVDDLTDTGDSMLAVLDYVNKEGIKEVKTATLQHINGSKYTPDYFAEQIEWKWVIFPWNFHEDMTALIAKVMEGKKMLLDDIILALKETNFLELEDLKVMAVLEDMETKNNIVSENRDGQIYWKTV